uniref:NADH-ubiquinone oxidoreductase chain 4 n=1 Tax=Pholcus sp. HCP-2014 TaxID=1519082 RepID=A0A0U1WNP9_9ARAC|nr:NADH dehydrogenase subunit 4 [Pholcus sp. HCP-2014]
MPMILITLTTFNSKKLMITCLSLSIMWTLVWLMQPSMYSLLLSNDNLSSLLIMLTMITTLLITLASSSSSTMKMISLINASLITAFMMTSMISFYVMFELSIIPTFLLIMKSGNQPERNKASLFLLMYTIFASIPLLLAIMASFPLTNMILIQKTSLSMNMPLFLILAFLVKLPMFTFHLWLPKAHVEAPMEGSMVLAAILLKLGSYGLMRMLPLMKLFNKTMSPLMMSISLMGCMITCITCNRQKDLKAMIAYSSVAHMALILISLFSLSNSGPNTTMLMTVSHAFSSSAMFFLATHTYLPLHSRNIHLFKGMTNTNPNMSMWWFMTMAANIGTPPFISLISETMAITSAAYWSLYSLIPLLMAGMLMTSFSINLYSQINHSSPSSNTKTPIMSLAPSLTMTLHLLPLVMLLMNPNIMMLLIS